MGIGFALRRPLSMLRGMAADRDRPDLRRLAAIEDPERFVWAILPHAARTFSASIVLLPYAAAKATAVAYLYCRMLDSYEDLIIDPAERDAALAAFAQRLDTGAPAPAVGENHARDDRDAVHLLLVERCELVDRVFVTFDPEVRDLTRTLVREMAGGMRWASATFLRQGGVLESEEQLARYCRNVIGQPVLFTTRLLHRHHTGSAHVPAAVEDDAMTVGEMIQLANVTRDIEKDLVRGVGYHPLLRGDLGHGVDGDASRAERVRTVRADLLAMALRRAPAYRRLIEFLSPHRISLARASGVLMLLFTDRYFRKCAERAGLRPWGPRRSGLRLMLSALPAFWSRRWAERVMAGIERDFLRAAAPA